MFGGAKTREFQQGMDQQSLRRGREEERLNLRRMLREEQLQRKRRHRYKYTPQETCQETCQNPRAWLYDLWSNLFATSSQSSVRRKPFRGDDETVSTCIENKKKLNALQTKYDELNKEYEAMDEKLVDKVNEIIKKHNEMLHANKGLNVKMNELTEIKVKQQKELKGLTHKMNELTEIKLKQQKEVKRLADSLETVHKELQNKQVKLEQLMEDHASSAQQNQILQLEYKKMEMTLRKQMKDNTRSQNHNEDVVMDRGAPFKCDFEKTLRNVNDKPRSQNHNEDVAMDRVAPFKWKTQMEMTLRKQMDRVGVPPFKKSKFITKRRRKAQSQSQSQSHTSTIYTNPSGFFNL